MRHQVQGTFEVKAEREPPYDAREGATIRRVTYKKQFSGPLNAESEAAVIEAVTSVKGSAGYVGIERVTGTLEGRSGSFVLQHSGLMDRGAVTHSVAVVPDSATGELTGLRGTMSIDIVDGEHRYRFEGWYVEG